MYRLSLFILCLLLSNVVSAALYQYTDKNGNIAFSDKPVEGSKKIRQNKPSVAPAPKQRRQANQNKQRKVAKPKVKKAKRYKFVKISSPADDQPFRSNNGDVLIVAQMSPELQTDFKHKLKLVLDGKTLPKLWPTAKIKLENIDRGTHKISIIIVNEKGKKLKQSSTTTFHLLRFSRIIGRQ